MYHVLNKCLKEKYPAHNATCKNVTFLLSACEPMYYYIDFLYDLKYVDQKERIS